MRCAVWYSRRGDLGRDSGDTSRFFFVFFRNGCDPLLRCVLRPSGEVTESQKSLSRPLPRSHPLADCLETRRAFVDFLPRITAGLMYDLRRLFCKPRKNASDRKTRGRYPCGQSSPKRGAPFLSFKTRVCDNITPPPLPPSLHTPPCPPEGIPSISKCHVKCFYCPALI